MGEYYYQIKGKSITSYDTSWQFPPIFSGIITATNKQKAKEIIESEYNKKFPLRVLRKDLDSNEFLLKVECIDENNYLKRLKDDLTCKECGNIFRRIDLYNDHNTQYKGTEYCSDPCNKIGQDRERNNRQHFFLDFEANLPVIYKITNKQTNKCYIGQTIQSFTLRWWQHIKWGNTSCKFHDAIKNSKLTDWTFEVIHIIDSQCEKSDTYKTKTTADIKKELDILEHKYITRFDSINNGYNTVRVNSKE